METAEAIVVGAGVVGLAVARALARRGTPPIVLEAAAVIGSETSSRNSEVVHAGLYYPPGGLKARLCVAGRRALYRFCADYGVAARPIGKLVVATDAASLPTLAALAARAAACGVTDLVALSAAAARDLEPALACVGALYAPSTGIVDGAGFMRALQGDAQAQGASIAFATRAVGGVAKADGVEIETQDAQGRRFTLKAKLLVNCAGLGAHDLARRLRGAPAPPPLRMARGVYFALAGRAPFSRLIYPVPEAGGLGVHLTLDLAGAARFGPDVEWVTAKDYTVDPARAGAFYASIRRYWPHVPDGALSPAYAGIRPKIVGPGEPAADFRIDGPSVHGVRGLVQLFGVESPGLTASLAIADHVGDLLGLPPERRRPEGFTPQS